MAMKLMSRVKKTVAADASTSSKDFEFEIERVKFNSSKKHVSGMRKALSNFQKASKEAHSAEKILREQINNWYGADKNTADVNEADQVKAMLTECVEAASDYNVSIRDTKVIESLWAEIEELQKLIDKRDRKLTYYEMAGGDLKAEEGQTFAKEQDKLAWEKARQDYRDTNKMMLQKLVLLQKKEPKIITGFLKQRSGASAELYRKLYQCWQTLDECFERDNKKQNELCGDDMDSLAVDTISIGSKSPMNSRTGTLSSLESETNEKTSTMNSQ